METTGAELRTKNREREDHETRSKKRKKKKKRKGRHYVLEVQNVIMGVKKRR